MPKARTKEETDKAFGDFEEYVKFIKAQTSVRYVTANELKVLYADRASIQRFTADPIFVMASRTLKEISFMDYGNFSLSAAEIFAILTNRLLLHLGDTQSRIPNINLQGPNRSYKRGTGQATINTVTGKEFVATVRDVVTYCRRTGRIPSEVWIGSKNISPQDYLATLASIVTNTWNVPNEVKIKNGNFTADKYVADDDPKIFNWVIHPEGFHAPKLMELAKLQAWTLKPAMMKK
jgi:hypothetical protein